MCLQSFCLEFLLLFLLSCCSSDTVCLQRFFVFVVNFINLSWKEFNIILIISIYWVELYNYLCFFLFSYSCFLFCFCLVPGVGVGGALAFTKKTRFWGSILLTIYICTSLLHLVFPFPPTLIAVSECDVLWTATCAVISLVGSVKSRF